MTQRDWADRARAWADRQHRRYRIRRAPRTDRTYATSHRTIGFAGLCSLAGVLGATSGQWSAAAIMGGLTTALLAFGLGERINCIQWTDRGVLIRYGAPLAPRIRTWRRGTAGTVHEPSVLDRFRRRRLRTMRVTIGDDGPIEIGGMRYTTDLASQLRGHMAVRGTN